MKTKLTILKLLILLCTFATTALFGQGLTYTWTGAANGTNIAIAGNWTTNDVDPATTLPSGAVPRDTVRWDNRTTTNLAITFSSPGLPGTGFGTEGLDVILTANQTNAVQFLSTVAIAPAVGINNITNNSANAALTLGDMNAATRLILVGRPAGAIHYFVNNSTAPASILAPVGAGLEWQAGGGTAFTLDFGGTGDWIVNQVLRNNNNNAGPISAVWQGPGTMTWNYGGTFLAGDAFGALTVNGGTYLVKDTRLLNASSRANQGSAATVMTINNGTLVFDFVGQTDTIDRTIAGASPGVLEMRNGTVTLSPPVGAAVPSTFSGNINLTGGTLIAGAAETPDVSGPLGTNGTISFLGGTLGFSVNNVYDYSPRFSTAASQAYSIDTGGQSVTFTNASGLTSSGGTLTKVGSGTLTLAGPSSYSGLTTVSAGVLAFQGTKTGTGSITVADSAALGVTVTGTQVTPGTLTLGTSGSATLGFDNVNSTTTAPIAAGTVSAGGPVTVNINSGTLAPGNSYPLLSWTSGSAPPVSLGILNGFIGNLSTNGNRIQLNVTATAYLWTGITDGNWDQVTANNWMQNGAPAVFANGGPVLFDDSSSRTNVTVTDSLLPTAVAINSTNPYAITSSGANNIGGSASLDKSGSGTLTLSGGANTFTGATSISGGTLSVGALANGSSASDIGASGDGAGNLVLDGGILQYTGGAASINRSFTVSTAGGTVDSSGSGALGLTNTGALGYTGNGARTLTLTGTNDGNNTLAPVLANNGGATAVTKSGPGKWILTANNSHSGVTLITGGILQIGAGGGTGSPGTGNITDNGQLVFNRTGTLTVGGIISGTGGVTNEGPGTVILSANNTYSGGTTINAGTLQVGSGGSTGSLNGTSPITNNSTLDFNTTGSFTYTGGGAISGTGNVIVRGNNNLIRTIGPNSYTGWTRIDAGATFQPCQGNSGALVSSVVTNNGTLMLIRQDLGVFFYSNNIVGSGRIVKEVNGANFSDVTLLGTNTYTGGTIIAGGEIVLGDGVTPGRGSIVGNVFFTNSVAGAEIDRRIVFNRAEDVTFSGSLSGLGGTPWGGIVAYAGRVEVRSAFKVTLTGNNSHLGGAAIVAAGSTLQLGNGGGSGSIGSGNIANTGTLILNRSDNVTLTNVISGVGSVVKTGSGTTTLNATNTYTGTTTVSNGSLVINGTNTAVSTTVYGGTLGGSGTLSGPVTLSAGTTLAPGASVGTLRINNNLTIGGNVAIEVNKSLSPSNDLVVVSGSLTNTGTGTLTIANLGPALVVGDKFTLFNKPVQNGVALAVTGSGATWTNNLAVDGSITVTVVTRPTLNFTQNGNSLQFSWNVSFGNYKLQAQTNSLNVGLSSGWADYPGSSTSPVTVPMDATQGTVYFRLVSTP